MLKETRRHSVETSQTQLSGVQAALHKRQQEEVKLKLTHLRGKQQQLETQLRASWNERNGQLWQRIENVIKLEENKVKAKVEAERRRREEEDRSRREAEEMARQEEERQREEAVKVQRQREEKEQREAKEEEERRHQTESEALRASQSQAQEEERKAIGLTTAAEDWQKGRELLKVCS